MAGESILISDRNPLLDGLRGSASFLIVLFHLVAMRNNSFAGGTALGVCGVDLFFLMSGGLIFRSIEKMPARIFLAKRLLRIYPSLIVSVIVSWLLHSLLALRNGSDFVFGGWDWLANLSGLTTMLSFSPLEGPHWTLVVEIQFYLVATLLALAPSRSRRPIAAILFAIELLVITQLSHTTAVELLQQFPVIGLWHLFFAGSILFRRGPLSSTDWVLLGACLVCGWCSWEVSGRTRFYISQPAALLMLIGFLAAIRTAIRSNITFSASIRCFLDWSARISYPLYLCHQMLGLALIAIASFHGVPPAVATLSGILAVIMFAWMVERCGDRHAVLVSKRIGGPIGWRSGQADRARESKAI